jgi:hypothetical protein
MNGPSVLFSRNLQQNNSFVDTRKLPQVAAQRIRKTSMTGHHGRSRFSALSINTSSFPPTDRNCTPIPLPGVAFRTVASIFNSPSTMAKISLSGVPTATTSLVTMNAPEALKSNTREVCRCFSNFHDTHIPVGVGTRRSFLRSGPADGSAPGSVLPALNFNHVP